MGLFRRPGKGKKKSEEEGDISMGEIQPLHGHESDEESDDSRPLPEVDQETTEKAQAVMKNHLGIMRDIVMKIRNEEGYAKSMYSNCPRLQHLLDRNPDLRPVFEDPRLVRINFETVYKEAGGILPEDEEEEERKRNNPSLLVRIANHPIFKLLKMLLFVKKLIGCIAGGGFVLLASCYGCCADCCTDCCCEDAVEEVGEIDVEEYDEDDENDLGPEDYSDLDKNQLALNTAADYMEDPEVQEQMQRLLEDPENLEDAIENDTELRALRDSNPLCAELMQDPETMRILVDPDNLRALGEAPQMIELDFADPTGFTPVADFLDIEAGNLEGLDTASGDGLVELGLDDATSMDGLDAYEADYDRNDIQFEMEEESLVGADVDDDFDLGDDDINEEETGWEDEETGVEAEATEVPEEAPATTTTSNWEDDFALEEQEIEGGDNVEGQGKGKGAAKKTEQKRSGEKGGGAKGLISSLGVAATDVIAAQIVGSVFGEIMPTDLLTGGGDMGLGGVEDAAKNAEAVINDDVAGIAEDAADELDDDKDDKRRGAAFAGGLLMDRRSKRDVFDRKGRKSYRGSSVSSEDDELDDGLDSINSSDDEDEVFSDEDDEMDDYDEDSKPKSKRKTLGFLKKMAAATVDKAKVAVKEHVAGTLLGDDIAEMLLDKMEEESESGSDDGSKNKSRRKDTEKKGIRGFFRRKKDNSDENDDQIDDQIDSNFDSDSDDDGGSSYGSLEDHLEGSALFRSPLSVSKRSIRGGFSGMDLYGEEFGGGLFDDVMFDDSKDPISLDMLQDREDQMEQDDDDEEQQQQQRRFFRKMGGRRRSGT